MKITDFRFLTDENIDVEILDYLRKNGLDVFDIKEKQLFRMPDEQILALSVEEKRVIITQDSDFGTMIFRDKSAFFGIIYLRPGHQSALIHLNTLALIFDENLELTPPFLLVAENTDTVIRLRLRQ
jgi:predicted nuclease of predicted toxin-antitoxin system